MRLKFVKLLAATAGVLALVACKDEPSKPKGPVTLKFTTPVYRNVNSSAFDTVRATVIVDGTDTVQAPKDTIDSLARGVHSFEAHLDIDYLVSNFSQNINPPGGVQLLNIVPAGTCRIYDYDASFCVRRNSIAWSGSRIYCPASDFGEFCTYFPDAIHLGGSWPVDSGPTAQNEYIAHGKLLIGATVGGEKVATAFYDAGDYSPRRRHHVIAGDSSYWQSEVWTDVRTVPLYPDTSPTLALDDRPTHLLGLSVRNTYVLPSANKNVMYVRFDVTNISDSADYRRVHPTEPVGGHTINNVYLTPLIDPDIGGIRRIGGVQYDDTFDDNATFFPGDSLVIAYDQEFAVTAFNGGYNNKPGLVGLRLVEAPAGTQAVALLLDKFMDLTYGTDVSVKRLEDSTYNVIAGGRAGGRGGCTVSTQMMVCKEGTTSIDAFEAEHDVVIGWSLGPITSIAPGQTVSLTVAIVLAPPTPGTFTSGASVAPQNADVTSTTRTIYGIASQLRALAATTKGFVVNGTPR